MAHAMVYEYAMGTGTTSMSVVGNDASESTRRVRDEEVRELADEGFRAALALIDTHRGKLDEIAMTLLKNEVLERGDLDRILGDVPKAAPERRGGGELGIAAATARNPAQNPPRV
jgi:ATP-dependent Zn protease